MEFWAGLGNLASVLQIITVIASVYAAIKLWQQNRRLRALAENTPPIENFATMRTAHDGVKTVAPVAFALSLTPSSDSIRPSVEQFLQHNGWKMDIEELNMNGLDPASNLEAFVNALRQKRRLFEAKGYTEVHVFISGPVVAGAIFGSLFDNWITVKMYHKPTPAPPQLYEYWMPLL